MHRTMAAMALSFLMAAGGGVAFAEATGQAPSSAAKSTPSSNQPSSTANSNGPVEFHEEEVATAPWTVESIDKQNHKMVLQSPDGTRTTVDVPAGTPGAASVKKGDQLELDYFDASVTGVTANRKVRNIRKMNDQSAHSGDKAKNSRSGH